MIEFICLFFPAFISLSVLERINKKKEIIERINRYAIYNILINTLVLLIVAYLTNFQKLSLDSNTFSTVFSLKYLVIASIIGLILPYMFNYVRKNFKIEIKREKRK